MPSCRRPGCSPSWRCGYAAAGGRAGPALDDQQLVAPDAGLPGRGRRARPAGAQHPAGASRPPPSAAAAGRSRAAARSRRRPGPGCSGRACRPTTALLRALAGSVAAGARRAGAPPPDEGRKYSPHLTLARCREPADVSTLTAPWRPSAARSGRRSPIHLVRSYLGGGQASRYEDVAGWPLTGRPRTGA